MKNNNVPAIRFKGFTDVWEQRKACDIFVSISDKNHPELPVLSASQEFGMVNRDSLDIQIQHNKDNESGYKRVLPGQFVIHLRSFQGGFAHSKIEGITSPAYTVIDFKNKENDSDEFWKYILTSRKFIKTLESVTYGIRDGRSISFSDFSGLKFYTAGIQEQKRIFTLLNSISNLITLHQRKLDRLQDLKKALLQKLFPKNGSEYPEVRFKGFTHPWEQRKFKELFAEKREKTQRENEGILLSCAITGIYLNSELFSHFRGKSNKGYLKVKKNDLVLSAQNLHLGNVNVNLKFDHGIISPAYKVYKIINSNPLFINAFMKKDTTKDFFLSVTTEGASQCRKNIEWKVLYEKSILMPSYEEQKTIGVFFESLDNLITLHQREMELLQETKKAFLQKLFV